MDQRVDGNTRSYEANGAISKHILVKLASGKIAIAVLGDEFLGTIDRATFVSGDRASVFLRSKAGTFVCVAADAIAAGAVVYGRAAGKIDDVSTTSAVRVGIALEAAAADGDLIEVLPA